MRDFDLSYAFNHSRLGSNGWNNLTFDDNSKSVSVLPHYNPNPQPNQNSINTHSLRLQSLLSEPPRPPASIYNCLESDQQEQGDIREVDYIQNEPEAKHVNSKQYFRMMKRRIKKVMDEYKLKEKKGNNESISKIEQNKSLNNKKQKYIY